MDCKSARLLLDFARPQARELEAEEAEALESHLDHCPDCHSRARSERQVDDILGRAMRQVEVPAGLRDQLLVRLEKARGDWHRQRFAHAARLSVAAAALLLLCWAGWYWVREHWVTPINLDRVANTVVNDATEDPLSRTERQLKALGADTPLPSQLFDFHLLACPPFLAELPGYPGRMVPSLLFVRNGRVARVYLIPEKAIPKDTLRTIPGGSFKAELLDWEDGPYRFLVIYDGGDLEWLRPPEGQKA
jgi:hypothetical protein